MSRPYLEYDEPYFYPRDHETDDYFGQDVWQYQAQDQNIPRIAERGQVLREDSGYYSGTVISPQCDVMQEQFRIREKVNFEDADTATRQAFGYRRERKKKKGSCPVDEAPIPPPNRKTTVRSNARATAQSSVAQRSSESSTHHEQCHPPSGEDVEDERDDIDAIRSAPRRTKTWAYQSDFPYDERVRRTPSAPSNSNYPCGVCQAILTYNAAEFRHHLLHDHGQKLMCVQGALIHVPTVGNVIKLYNGSDGHTLASTSCRPPDRSRP